MIRVAEVKSGQIWFGGRSHRMYLDLDTEQGYICIMLDSEGKWSANADELDSAKEPADKPETLRRIMEREARERGDRSGIARTASKRS